MIVTGSFIEVKMRKDRVHLAGLTYKETTSCLFHLGFITHWSAPLVSLGQG